MSYTDRTKKQADALEQAHERLKSLTGVPTDHVCELVQVGGEPARRYLIDVVDAVSEFRRAAYEYRNACNTYGPQPSDEQLRHNPLYPFKSA